MNFYILYLNFQNSALMTAPAPAAAADSAASADKELEEIFGMEFKGELPTINPDKTPVRVITKSSQ